MSQHSAALTDHLQVDDVIQGRDVTFPWHFTEKLFFRFLDFIFLKLSNILFDEYRGVLDELKTKLILYQFSCETARMRHFLARGCMRSC